MTRPRQQSAAAALDDPSGGVARARVESGIAPAESLSADALACLDETIPPEVCWTGAGECIALFLGRAAAARYETEAANVSLFGTRVNARNHGPEFPSLLQGLMVFNAPDFAPCRVDVGDVSIAPIGFSPDGRRLGLLRLHVDRHELAWVDVRSRRMFTLPGRVNSTSFVMGYPPCGWMPGGRSLWCRLVPEPRHATRHAWEGWAGAAVLDTTVHRAQAHRLFINRHSAEDEVLARRYCTSQLALISAEHGSIRHLGSPGIFRDVRPSPDGRYLLAERCLPPYADAASLRSIARRAEVWDVERDVTAWDSDAAIGPGGVRGVSDDWRWDPLEGSTLMWSDRRHSGDGILRLPSPFVAEPSECFRTEGRCRRLAWTADGRYVTWEQKSVEAPQVVRLRDRDGTDRGRLCDDGSGSTWSPFFRTHDGDVLAQSGDAIFVKRNAGPDLTPAILVDRVELGSESRARAFESASDEYEDPVAMLEPDGPVFLTRRESSRLPQRYCILHGGSGRRIHLGEQRAPTCIARASRSAVRYSTPFGPRTTAVYLPAQSRTSPPPVVVWVYPQIRGVVTQFGGFTDGKGVASLNRYPTYQRHWCQPLPLVAHGYGVVETAPIPMDPSTEALADQLIEGASSLLDALVETGRADPRRVAIGGHCGGAWIAALLMARTKLFHAGIFCSGFYNVAAKPIQQFLPGAKLWVDPRRFIDLSPIFDVDAITDPVLIFNGSLDPGELWGEGERLYGALALAGGTARYVLVPGEGHTALQREAHELMLVEMLRWCNLHLLGA